MTLHPTGIALAALACFVSGFLWFGPKTFFPVWWKAMGRTEPLDPQRFNMAKVFGGTLAAILVQAFVCDVILSAIRVGYPALSVGQGAAWGFHLGLVAAAPSLSHRLFAGHGFTVWIIEVANDILNFTIMGAILVAVG
jgi:hypothetical protein